MVSMKDIAKECGVSVATVSKALSGQQDISKETQDRIKEVASRMGYQANSAARALKTKRTYNIGVLLFDERNSGLAHDYFSSILESIRVEAERKGYDITFISSNVGKRSASYLQHCRYRGVDGIVIVCVDYNDPMVKELADSDIPLVTIDHVFNNRTAVMSDNVRGAEELTRRAIEKGHRKIAYIHGELTAVTTNRLLGFYRACEEQQISVEDSLVKQSAYHDSDRCYEIVKQMLKEKDTPTCILLPDDFSAIGGINAIREKGLRIPEDISILGYDGIGISQVLAPRLSTWKQNTEELGRVAVDKLVRLIEQPKTTIPETVTVQGHFMEGESLAQVTK